MTPDLKELSAEIARHSAVLGRIRAEVKKTIIGQDVMLDRLLVGLLTRGHILLEGVPGLAKTLCIKTLAKALNTGFSRIQFTPDLLPADLLGTRVYNQATGEFSTKKGPIFTNLLLADEINRAPAKVQSALLEVMQEQQVTIGPDTFHLEQPFLVMATQNPIESEGTYRLPEAQVDRFMLKVGIGYPTREEELAIIDLTTKGSEVTISPVAEVSEIFTCRELVNRVYADEKVKRYVVDLIFATREPEKYGLDIKGLVEFGASPRASIYLTMAAKAEAMMNGRAFVTPEDVKEMAPDVLRHRLTLTYEAEADEITTDNVIDRILGKVPTP
ncbi:MAG: MoxR family ATPase [Nitrospirae bacterium]|nr:MoxR family ATPase [Nitrospirota bacterium]